MKRTKSGRPAQRPAAKRTTTRTRPSAISRRQRIAGLISATTPVIDAGKIVSRDFKVPSGDPGIDIFVRNKRHKDLGRVDETRTLLFLHGGTQASEATFDLRLDGFSWADYIAAHGWDVWLMDLRGYGASTRPPEMSMPPMDVRPVGPLDTQIAGFGAVVAYIKRVRKLSKLNVLGWSWGCVVSMSWAAAHPQTIGRIGLFAPPWLIEEFAPTAQAVLRETTPLPGYESWTTDDAWKRFKLGIPEGAVDDLTPLAWRKTWAAATVATDPLARTHKPPRVRSPLGVVPHLREVARTGKPMFPARDVRSPILIVVGEWDGLTTPKNALALLHVLDRSPEKRLTVLGKATHVAHLERNRLALFAVVQAFLEGR